MKSDQELISESRKLFNLITNEPNIPKCRAYIEEFVEKYETYPSLAEVISSLNPKRKDDKKGLGTLEKKALKEIQRTFDLLTKKYRHKQINIPQNIIDAYEQKTLSSAGCTASRFDAVQKLIFLLEAKGELSAIKKFVILDPKGNIDACIFSPSYFEWHQEMDTVRKSAWYCYDQIIYLKNNPSDLLFIEDHPLEDNNQYRVLQRLQAIMLQLDPQNALMQYKRCIKVLHDYAKSFLLGKEKKPDSYNKKTGVLVKNGIKIPFKSEQLRGKILTLLYPKGKPRTTPIPFDEIYDKAIRSEADTYWDNLDTTKRTRIKKQIFEIYEGINDRVSKKTNKPYLIAENLNLNFV